MRDANRRVSRVHRLSTRPRRAECIDAQILRLNLDVNVLGLRQHRNSDRRRMHAPLRLRRRNALHAMHAALIFQLGVDLVAFDDRDDFL